MSDEPMFPRFRDPRVPEKDRWWITQFTADQLDCRLRDLEKQNRELRAANSILRRLIREEREQYARIAKNVAADSDCRCAQQVAYVIERNDPMIGRTAEERAALGEVKDG